jgi:hypothetical protein
VKDGAEQFLLRLLPDDKAQVGEFSDKIKFHPGNFIDDRDRLIYLLKHELDFGYPTRLYDAVDESIERSGPDGRTQGRPRLHRRRRHGEQAGVGKVMDSAREKDVMVYASARRPSTSTASSACAARPTAAEEDSPKTPAAATSS